LSVHGENDRLQLFEEILSKGKRNQRLSSLIGAYGLLKKILEDDDDDDDDDGSCRLTLSSLTLPIIIIYSLTGAVIQRRLNE